MSSSIAETIQKYVVEQLLEGEGEGLDLETDLVASGLLDSFAVVQMLTFIEEQFDIEVPRTKISVRSFRCIRVITDLVESTLRQQRPA